MVTRQDNELYHYGVKGMKWGVRRRSDQPTFRQYSKKARADGLAARKAARDSGQLKGIGAVRKGNKIQRDATKASLKEQKQVTKAAKKRADKAIKKLQKTKIKDLEKRYGELEDSMDYGKKADSRNNRKIQTEMTNIENEIRKMTRPNK